MDYSDHLLGADVDGFRTDEDKKTTYANIVKTTTRCRRRANSKKQPWIADSSVTEHTVGDRAVVYNYMRYKRPRIVWLGNGRVLQAIGQGVKQLMIGDGGTMMTALLQEVLVVPGLDYCLLSVKQVVDNDKRIYFDMTARSLTQRAL